MTVLSVCWHRRNCTFFGRLCHEESTIAKEKKAGDHNSFYDSAKTAADDKGINKVSSMENPAKSNFSAFFPSKFVPKKYGPEWSSRHSWYLKWEKIINEDRKSHLLKLNQSEANIMGGSMARFYGIAALFSYNYSIIHKKKKKKSTPREADVLSFCFTLLIFRLNKQIESRDKIFIRIT